MSTAEQTTAIVTGGTRGLGRELSLTAARAGYRVLALYHADIDAAARLDEAFAEEQLSARSYRFDVTTQGADATLWSEPEIAEAGGLMLIHNASSGFEPKPMHLLSWEEFSAALDVSLKGLWVCTMGVLRPMLKLGGGTVVSVLTTALLDRPPKGFTAYRAAKSAQQSFMLSLAAEYGERGIRAFSIAPGFMHTSMTEDWHPTLKEAVLAGGAATEPAAVAERTLALVRDPNVAGRGETYTV